MDASWIGLVLSGLGLFLSSWIVIPAATLSLLPLSVAAPEISPMLLLGHAILLGSVSAIDRLTSWKPSPGLYRLTIGLSMVSFVLSSLPLLQLPITIQQSNSAMQSALGQNYLTRIPASVQATMRPKLVRLSLSPVRQQSRQFSTADGTPLSLQVFQPLKAGRYPTIVTLYGGAWQRGDPGQNTAFNQYMAAQGYTVVAIDYRHAPQHQFPTQLHDVQSALQFLVEQSASLEIDPTRLSLVGWSAGAHLAMLAAYQPDTVPVQAVVSYYGPTDLLAGYADLPSPDPIDIRAVLETFLGGSPAQVPDRYRVASPIHHVRAKLPPTLLIYGQRDHIVKATFGQQLHDRLVASENTAVLLSLPWSDHAFDAVFRGLGNQIALYQTERFLGWALQAQPPDGPT
jgi:acetyl esterase/lipase